ncbi:MAG TPA: hypothetical protein VM942_05015 [Acidimicrobiales bacterium]|nr:hypothetical protein [Acidimicrobiales bacterium]
MLASTGRIGGEGDFAFQPKLDGWRAVVHVTVPRIAVYTRPGREVAATLPELAGLSGAVPPGTVLDGELVAGTGRPSSFYRLGSLLAARPERRRRSPTFAAFDLLALAGRPVMDLPHEERRSLLRDLELAGPAWCTVSQWTGIALTDLVQVCEELNLEGLVGKRLGSRYRPGERSPDWVKLKTTAWRTMHGPYRHNQAASR